jgi:hypothetical protein
MAGESQQLPETRPDPTVLTTEQLLREVGQVRDLLKTEVEGIRRVFEEKFSAVDRQFVLIEQQRVEQKVDTKTAVDAALRAQQEAVKEQTTASERAIAKSEAATTKSIEQLGSTFTTAFDGQRRDIDDLKERVTEANATHVESDRGSDKASTATLAMIGIGATLFVTFIIIIANVLTTSGP